MAMGIREQRELIVAWTQGAELEFLEDGVWKPVESILRGHPSIEYRRKPIVKPIDLTDL
jgi:hypothetical protein